MTSMRFNSWLDRAAPEASIEILRGTRPSMRHAETLCIERKVGVGEPDARHGQVGVYLVLLDEA